MIHNSSDAQPYPNCPSLTYMIAKRVTNKFEDSDAFISFTGRKGSGKTTSSVSFCEDLALMIAMCRNKGEPPEKFFNIDHIKSVTETGALELLSSGALKTENAVFLLDDTGTQWGARNWNSPINKTLNSILQICRIYKCVIVANFILQTHIDIQARGMADYRAQMLYKDTKRNRAYFKFYYLEQGEYRGKQKEYKKFMTWHGKRIIRWAIRRPSPALEFAVKQIRRDNTDLYIEDAAAKVQEVLDKEKERRSGESHAPMKKTYKESKDFNGLKEKVMAILNNPKIPKKQKTPTALARKLKTTRYRVEMAGDF